MNKTYLVTAALIAALASHARAETSDTSPHGVTVFLDGSGPTLRPGYDDGAAGRSSMVAARGLDRLKVPAFRGGGEAWRAIVACVRDGYAEFAVDVVDVRPASGTYVTIVVGGRPGMLGYGSSVSGMAPYSGDLIEGAVGFVFSELMANRVRAVCETVMHELGHALGLDHSRHCGDVMSYERCGEKAITDVVAACGEGRDRRCGDGAETQSSRALLARTVGLRAPGGGDGGGDGDSDGDGNGNGNGNGNEEYEEYDGWLPEVGIEVTGIEIRGRWDDRVVRLTARTKGNVAAIDLAWATPDEVYLLRCGEIPDELPVTCRRRGDQVVFALRVGAGPRSFAMRVLDDSGRAGFSEPRRLSRRGRRR